MKWPTGFPTSTTHSFVNCRASTPFSKTGLPGLIRTAPQSRSLPFSASAAAYLAGKDEIVCNNMHEMGMKMGYAFQLLDDISDYFPSNKGFGNDRREDRKTAILILCDQENRKLLSSYREMGKNLTQDQIFEFRNTFRKQFLNIIDWAVSSLQEAESGGIK